MVAQSAASLSDDQEQEEPKTRRREEEGRANPIHPLSAVRKGDEPPQPVHVRLFTFSVRSDVLTSTQSYSEGPPPQRNAGFPPFDPQLHDDQRRGWDRAGPYHHPLPSRPPAWSAPFPAPPFPNFDPRFPGPPPSHRPPPHFQAPLSFPQMSAADYPPHFPTLPTRPLTPPIPKSPSLEPPPAPVIEPEPPKPPAPPPKRVSLSSLRAMIGARKTQEVHSALDCLKGSAHLDHRRPRSKWSSQSPPSQLFRPRPCSHPSSKNPLSPFRRPCHSMGGRR